MSRDLSVASTQRTLQGDSPAPFSMKEKLETALTSVGGEDGSLKGDDDAFLVSFAPDDPLLPMSKTSLQKWSAVLAISFASACVTCTSSMATSTYVGIRQDFGISKEVAILSVSLYCAGLGFGPLLLGPLSEFIGRNRVYFFSFLSFILLNFPVAFAPANAAGAPVHFVFRFFTGFVGSAFLSVAGGSVSDLFENEKVGPPMAVYTVSPFLGPVLGPLVAGFINENTSWRWTYYTVLIWATFELAALYFLVPETHAPTILKAKADKLRKETGDSRYWTPAERQEKDFKAALKKSVLTPFSLIYHEPMALSLNIWTAILLGILYLNFQAYPIVFRGNHGFSLQQSGLTFLGIGLGMVLGVCSQPIWKKLYLRDVEKYGGQAPPESRLYSGMLGAILCPVSIFLFAGTSIKSVHWIVPIIMSIPFGAGIALVYTAVFTFLVDAYRPVAASAMASNSFMRATFAAGFPLFASQLYNCLGTVGSGCLIGGILVIIAPLPFIFYRYGAHLRRNSRFTEATLKPQPVKADEKA